MISRRLIIKSCVIFGSFVIAISIFLKYYGIQAFLNFVILRGTLLVQGSERFEKWETIPFPLHFKVYIFNITNPFEVTQGDKPIVNEMGPYYYDQYRKKHNITVKGDFITYSEERIFVFNQEKTGADWKETDFVTTANLAFLGTAMHLESKMPMALSILEAASTFLFEESELVFRTSTVKDLLFAGTTVNCSHTEGVGAMLCKGLIANRPETIRPKPNSSDLLFAFFHHKNATLSKLYNISSGVRDYRTLGQIISYDSKENNSAWLSQKCNRIHGTDTNIFQPFLSKSDHLYIYDPNICRSMFVEYEDDSVVEGVPTCRFILSPDNLANVKTNPDNKCFCSPGKNPKCLKKGAFSPYKCTNQPTVTTYPHFFEADCEYINYVEGLNPKKELHQTFTDIEMNTGIPLRGAKRLQFNLFLNPIDGISALQNVTPGLLPLLWIDEGMEPNIVVLMPTYVLQFLIKLFSIILWIFFVTGALCLLIVPLIIIVIEERQWSGFARSVVHPTNNDLQKTLPAEPVPDDVRTVQPLKLTLYQPQDHVSSYFGEPVQHDLDAHALGPLQNENKQSKVTKSSFREI